MPVEFTVRTADLGQAISELQANRGDHNAADPVDITVSETSAKLNALGTEAEIPVASKHTGALRIPFHIMLRIYAVASTLKVSEVVNCKKGSITIGRMVVNHRDIELRKPQTHRLDIPVDISILDPLALEQILDPKRIIAEGLRPRVTNALAARSSAIYAAAAALEPLGVTKEQLQRLVDFHVLAAAKRLRPTLASSL